MAPAVITVVWQRGDRKFFSLEISNKIIPDTVLIHAQEVMKLGIGNQHFASLSDQKKSLEPTVARL